MRAKNILVIFFLQFFAYAQGQTFNKYFVVDSTATLAYSLNLRDSFFFVAGVKADPNSSGAIASFLAKFDYSGNMIWDTILRPSQYPEYYMVQDHNGLITTSDQGLAAVGVVTNSSSKELVLFSKFDSTGNLTFYKTYSPNIPGYKYFYAYKILEFDSAYYLIGGIQLASFYVEAAMIKLDLAGNLEFIKYYDSLPNMYGEVTESAALLSDSTILISLGRTDLNINYWQEVDNTCFLIVDTAGNLLRKSCTTDGNTLAYYNVATTADGNYLSCGSYYSNRVHGIDEAYSQYLAKWDTAFNKKWEINLKSGVGDQDNALRDFKLDLNSNIILCGQNADSLGLNGVIAKVDKNGTLIYYHRFAVTMPADSDYQYSWNYLDDITLMPNGDIVAVGYWQSTLIASPLGFEQVGWILRVDSDGCMDDGSCGITGIDNRLQPLDNRQPIQVFPNPSNGIFTITVLVPLSVGSVLEVYDALGQKVHSLHLFNRVSLVNLYHLASGIYFYRIDNGLVKIGEGKFVIQH